MNRKGRIVVWSDYVCPFCYLEEPVLERIRQAPVPTLDPNGEYLHSIWNRVVYPMARERGMTYGFLRFSRAVAEPWS
jgi:DSBA-like thioredoxin domain